MEIHFYKYQGTGNDFIMIDDRSSSFPTGNKELIAGICHRRYGIGADGLILLQQASQWDFRMVYFNADGNESTMCGNGGRCIVAFAKQLGIIEKSCNFIAIDGPHEGVVDHAGAVKIRMKDVTAVEQIDNDVVTDTGSPHYVRFVEDVSAIDVAIDGAAIRYSAQYAATGINVNFVEVHGGIVKVATYERGVEDETYSCGTGVVASVLAAAHKQGRTSGGMLAETKGGQLSVSFESTDSGYTNIYLRGPARLVFDGTYYINS